MIDVVVVVIVAQHRSDDSIWKLATGLSEQGKKQFIVMYLGPVFAFGIIAIMPREPNFDSTRGTFPQDTLAELEYEAS